MKRLTINYPDGTIQATGTLDEITFRLAAYEDTGLEPENVLTALEMAYLFVDLRKLEEVKKAESEGRLLILPCKVGDVLHRIYSMNHIEEDRAMGFLVSASGVWYWDENYRETPIEKIGKTVFLTREEAEAALRGGADDDDR